MQTYTFHVSGMHCKSCVLMTESEIKEVAGVTNAKTSLASHSVEVTGEFGDKTPQQIAHELSQPLLKHGYSLSVEKQKKAVRWSEFKFALPVAVALILGFVFLQQLGFVGAIGSNVTYGTSFLIGLIASVSTCLAVVGGLVLSVSANYAKQGSPWRPQMLFHIGRLAGFFVLGGVIGVLGKSFNLGFMGNTVLALIIGAVMLILGVNLLDIFHGTKKFQITMPQSVSKFFLRSRTTNQVIAPALLGVATFFLPCGFTQSMQIYALSTGSFFTGAMTMFVFALGTLPALALLSTSSAGIAHKPWKGVFFKTAGLIVIALALFNILNALAAAGIIAPIFNL